MAFSSLEVQRRLIQTKYTTGFTLKRNDSQTFKSIAIAKNFSSVCMLLVQLASINYFYSVWQLEDNVFYKSLSLPWGSFQLPCSYVVWKQWFEIILYFNFHFHHTNTKVKVQCKYQLEYEILIYHTKDITKRPWPY